MLDIVRKQSSNQSKVTFASSSSNISNTSSKSWMSKYEPTALSEVPVHNTKVKSTKDWLRKALSICNDGGPVSVLAVCGNSGCCKSIAVELICKEMQIEVVVWNNNMWDGSHNLASLQSTKDYHNNQNSNSRDLFKLSENGARFGSKKEEILDDFALRSKYPSLGLATKSINSNSNNDNKHRRINAILGRSSSTIALNNPIGGNKIVLIHDPPQVTFNSHNNFNSRDVEALYAFILQMGCPVVIIVSDVSGRDEFTYAAERCLPAAIRDCVLFESSFFPAITELKVIKILEKIAKSEGLFSRVSRPQLETLASSCGGDLRHAINQLQLLIECVPSYSTTNNSASDVIRSNQLTDVIDLTQDSDSDTNDSFANKRQKQSNGDAVNSRSISRSVSFKVDAQLLAEGTQRDLGFSSMHSVAKVLNAKLNNFGLLDFQPDEVMDRSDMSTDMTLSFLQGNCIENFIEKCRCLYAAVPVANAINTIPSKQSLNISEMIDEDQGDFPTDEYPPVDIPSDIITVDVNVDMTCLEQLERALSYYSDVDILLSKKYEASTHIDREMGIFPDVYVTAMTSRSAAVSRGAGFHEIYDDARQSRSFRPAFMSLKRPKIINMRTSALGMTRRLSEIRENIVSLTHENNPGELVRHSLSVNSDLILCTIPFYRAIKSASREHHAYQQIFPIFNEWIDWKIDSLQQSSMSNNDKIIKKDANEHENNAKMTSLEIDFSSNSIIDDIIDD